MTDKDIVFRKIAPGEMADPNSFCHYGWEGTGSFAFWRYATAYYDSAEVLYEKFKVSAGHNDMLDGLGMTMCFLYRHFVELTIKHLFVHFVCSDENEYKKYLENGHDLYKLWHAIKHKLSELKKRVGSSVDIGTLEHYIMEFDHFDKDSMTMRYPIKKDLKPMNGSTRLDIPNLHDCVKELYWAFTGLSNDLDNQLLQEVEENKVDEFLEYYEQMRARVAWLIESMKQFAEKENNEFRFVKMSELKPELDNGMKMMEVFKSCSDDELIMFDTLYYTGRAILNGELRLPKNPHDAKKDAAKMCVINMKHDGLEFGEPKNDMICIHEKQASAIVMFIGKCIEVIDWDK